LSDTQQAWLIIILIDYLLQLVSSVDPAILKLTKTDNEIYDHFRSEFPDLKIDKIDTDEMKSLFVNFGSMPSVRLRVWG
jgi:hypothetical protein